MASLIHQLKKQQYEFNKKIKSDESSNILINNIPEEQSNSNAFKMININNLKYNGTDFSNTINNLADDTFVNNIKNNQLCDQFYIIRFKPDSFITKIPHNCSTVIIIQKSTCSGGIVNFKNETSDIKINPNNIKGEYLLVNWPVDFSMTISKVTDGCINIIRKTRAFYSFKKCATELLFDNEILFDSEESAESKPVINVKLYEKDNLFTDNTIMKNESIRDDFVTNKDGSINVSINIIGESNNYVDSVASDDY